MNAQFKACQTLATAPTLAAGAEVCPAAAIGLRLVKIGREIERLDQLALDQTLDLAGDQRQLELIALEDFLSEQLEWVTPKTAVGALLTVATLRRVAQDEIEHDDANSFNRFNRLIARLSEYLEAAAGATPLDLGLERYFLKTDATGIRDEYFG